MNIFNGSFAPFPNFDHIEDILEMIIDLLLTVLTRFFCFFYNRQKMSKL